MSIPARRGGRPSRLKAAQLQDSILDVATELFLNHGFGATSIEAVAKGARISKRTFYHRYRDKAALFQAVMRRLIERWLSPSGPVIAETGPLEEVLVRTALRILSIALSEEALALHRLLVAEAKRFPELAEAVTRSGARQGIERMVTLLAHEQDKGHLAVADAGFAAEQFITMVLAVPRHRALGFGEPLDDAGLERWARATVALFLDGCKRRGA